MPEPAKKTAFSSTAATLAWARKIYGYDAVALTSWWLPAQGKDKATGKPRSGGVRKDAWGFQDAQVLDGLPGLLALQACGTDVGPHIKKLDGEPARTTNPKQAAKAAAAAEKLAGSVRRWLGAGNRIAIVAWRKIWVKTSATTRRYQWAPRVLTAALDLEGIPFNGRAPLRWTEHEAWPITTKEVAPGNQTCTELATAPPEAPASGGSLELPLFEKAEG